MQHQTIRETEAHEKQLNNANLTVFDQLRSLQHQIIREAEAYEKALSDGPKSLVSALKKNLYGSIEPSNLKIEYIRNYISNLRDELDIKSDSELSGGFPDINF